MIKRLFTTLLPLLMILILLVGCSTSSNTAGASGSTSKISKTGSYTTKDDVALYLHTYKKLPSNFITKKEAQKLGWDNKKGNLDQIAPGKSIGGDHFGNYEDQLPDAKGRSWKECDINYTGGYRGGERIVFSSDGLIYYSKDHYQNFKELKF